MDGTDLEWAAALDRAIGSAPPADASLEQVLARGRRALRRRRAAWAVAGLGAVAIAVAVPMTLPDTGTSTAPADDPAGVTPTRAGIAADRATQLHVTLDASTGAIVSLGRDAFIAGRHGRIRGTTDPATGVMSLSAGHIAEKVDQPDGPGTIAYDARNGHDELWTYRLRNGQTVVSVPLAGKTFDEWVAGGPRHLREVLAR